ncbi:hypothetical protein CN378_08855 [Bacillus sp. AFS015802]|uniref:hypothetical protein n=1 Tax=Bacillus sp. AFS015802 TaxID=2033486 RepID=UPI000BF7E4D1|nr:hypothetical protein [Bacillus sp. AFS015802]PFA68201.1 hypothetical protein CN378_08855 [Bacillus sp. AFS015802]
MSSKKGQGKGQKQCNQYGEYQWMIGEMGPKDAKGGKEKQKGKGKQEKCGCMGYYYECMKQGQKGKGKGKGKDKGKK